MKYSSSTYYLWFCGENGAGSLLIGFLQTTDYTNLGDSISAK